jgi:hypothetical protein
MMQNDGARNAARSLRRNAVLSPPEILVLKAGVALRRTRGIRRDQYQVSEVELVARARRLALETGQVKLSRFLTLRRQQRNMAFRPGATKHECPKCGDVHCEPRLVVTRALQRTEEAVVRRSLEKKR